MYFVLLWDMKLHIFNPDNDLALASGRTNYTSPLSARKMGEDLALLPRIWADGADEVILPADNMAAYARKYPDAEIVPWGWNPSLLYKLTKAGFCNLPSAEHVENLRRLSNRATSVKVLNELRRKLSAVSSGMFCGESTILSAEEDVETFFRKHGKLVLKSPWSCSGKGVRFIDSYDDNVKGWVRRVINSQGSVEAELFYDKVADFAMELESSGDGSVEYLGLSVFTTERGAYLGNIVASEDYKMRTLSTYFPGDVLKLLREELIGVLGSIVGNEYRGIVGVDMMVCRSDDGRMVVHPCVEVNLRRTMGWVSLQLSPGADGSPRRYFIDYDADSRALSVRVKAHLAQGSELLTPISETTNYVALLANL